jgi:hypothetical protein
VAPTRLKKVAVLHAASDDVRPAAIRRVDAWIRGNISGVRDATDKRGFRLLQWDPPVRVAATRPWELSLEHEARLSAPNRGSADRLIDALLASEGKSPGDFLLPSNPQFAHLSGKRLASPP